MIVAHDTNNGAADTFRRTRLGYQKTDRLLKRLEFRRLYQSGRQVANGNFAIRYSIRPLSVAVSIPRLGVTVSKRVGNAVVRNRVKRLVREYFRCHREMLPGSIDLNVIARAGASKQSRHLLRASLETLFKKIKVRENHQPTD